VPFPTRDDLTIIVERTLQREETVVEPVLDREEILGLKDICKQVLAAPHVQSHAIDLVMATQPDVQQSHELTKKYIRFGSSPRGAQALVECGRVHALFNGRMHLAIEDIDAVAPAVLRHRIILNFDAHADGQNPETILSRIIPSVRATVGSRA
jgi:MoxR-like ATPase